MPVLIPEYTGRSYGAGLVGLSLLQTDRSYGAVGMGISLLLQTGRSYGAIDGIIFATSRSLCGAVALEISL